MVDPALHREAFKMSWATSLKSKHGQAVNPHIIEAYFVLLKEMVVKYNITEDCTYGTDAPLQRARKRGWWVGTKLGHSINNREGIVKIPLSLWQCALMALQCHLLWYSKARVIRWSGNRVILQIPCEFSKIYNNKSNMTYYKHRISHSIKGWTNGEIGITWIKEFDQNTTRKANGQYCLLIDDSHNSHYTWGFLEYVHTHKILVLGYPAHMYYAHSTGSWCGCFHCCKVLPGW